MKIGIDCRMIGHQFTGIGIYLENLIKNLTKMDTKNSYILFVNANNPISFKLPQNFITKEVNCPIYSLKEQIILPILLYKENCNLIHFPHFNAPILYLKKNIITIHDLTLHMFPGKKYSKIYHKLAYRISFYTNCLKAKKIICVSQNTKKDLIETYPSLEKNSEVILLGSNFNLLKKQAKKEDYILYYGNWKSHKNLETLIKAFNILKKDYKRSEKLVITGNPSPENPKPIKAIKKSKFKKVINCVGHISPEKLLDTIQKAKLVVIPSLYEGFGLQIIESLSNKTNVIASNISSLPEVGGKAALYFNPKDPQEIAYQANKVLSSDDLQLKLLNNYDPKKFSYIKMTKKTLKTYQEV